MRAVTELSTITRGLYLLLTAGDLYSDSENHLSSHRAEMLLFIKHNLKFIKRTCTPEQSMNKLSCI